MSKPLKNWIYPQIHLNHVTFLLLHALAGALMAGIYGILHDQVTYTLSPEYFTKFKFHQFASVNYGLPDRAFVSQIGFLATWWVGLISGYLIGRSAILPDGRSLPWKKTFSQLLLLLIITLTTGAIGYLYGALTNPPPLRHWGWFLKTYNIKDISAFIRVGKIHNFGYIGAAIGLVITVIMTRRLALTERAHKHIDS